MVRATTVGGLVILGACGSDVIATESAQAPSTDAAFSEAQDTEAPEVAEPDIAEREAEVEPAALAMFDFIGANPTVCPAEFASFNVEYPEDGDEDIVAELDAGIEDRGEALMSCLDAAGESDMSENVALLTAWGRHLSNDR